jgi:beta-glucosidase
MDEVSDDRPEHVALIRRAAAEAMVLLKNENDLLPLTPPDGTLIAVIGPNGDELVVQGGGSSRVEPHHERPFLDALREALGPGVAVEFEAGCRIHRRTPTAQRHLATSAGAPGIEVEYFDNTEFEGDPVLRKTARRFEFRWLGATRPRGITGQFTLRARTKFTAPVTGAYRFTLTSSGLSRLFIDGELALDAWTQQTPGRSFYGQGSEEIGIDVGLDAGESRELVLEYQAPARATIPGVRVGCHMPEPHNGIERAVELAQRADAVVLVGGLNADWEAEGADRVSLSLPGAQDELLAAVTAANPNTVVVINAGSPVAMPWLEQAGAVLQAWYPGQEGGDSLADVLTGKAEPGGRLPTTFAARVEDHPSNLTYPGEAGEVHYGEDVFVGYRAFDRTGIAPLFPFGHGLSYTTFAYENVRLDREEFRQGDSVTVRLDVLNTGDRAGSDVVQVYVGDLESSLLRPVKELKGFAKVRLGPGERQEVAITLEPRAFQAWDPRLNAWVAEPGDFVVNVGWSSTSFAAELPLRLV